MTCPRCHKPMTERKRSYHKRRKWVCSNCGKARMQVVKAKSHRIDTDRA